MTVFEHPLNERIRGFMRLQQLFLRLDHHLNGQSRADLQASIGVLLEIYELTARNNLKTEVLKELERQNQHLLSKNNDNDDKRIQLQLTSESLESLRNDLYQQPTSAYQQLSRNEFLSSIKHRCGITGTGNTFELPLYHFWLDKDPLDCRNTIVGWMQPYRHLREAIDYVLSNIRNHGKFKELEAERGFYQNSLKAEKSLQLVRVQMLKAENYYPEISAGIHRITIRFMHFVSANEKPTQCLDNIGFRIAYCDL